MGLDPRRICAVTFTNKAADEIASRLRREIGPEADEVTRGTLHALCLALLREHAALMGLRRGFGLADEDYQKRVLRRLRIRPERQAQLLRLFGRHQLEHYPLSRGRPGALRELPRGASVAQAARLQRPHRPHRRPAPAATPRPRPTSAAGGTRCWWTSSRT